MTGNCPVRFLGGTEPARAPVLPGRLPFDNVGAISFAVFRMLGCAAVLLPPTVLMGGTLPLLAKYCVRVGGDGVGKRLGRLYGVNTAGGVLGCMGSAFVVIPALGLRGALLTAAGLSLATGIGTLLVPERSVEQNDSDTPDQGQPDIPDPAHSGRLDRAMAGAFFLAGMGALGLEGAWTRLLAFNLNETAQAFATMLAVYLLGIALGSALGGNHVDTRWQGNGDAESDTRRWAGTYAGFAYAIAVFCVLTLGAWAFAMAGKTFPRVSASCLALVPSGWRIRPVEFLFQLLVPAGVLVFLPAVLMGMAFPFAGRFFARRAETAGRGFGRAYMLNTLGCMLGPLVCGYVLMPMLGVQAAILCCAGLWVAAGSIVRVGLGRQKPWEGVLVTGAFFGLAVLLPDSTLTSVFAKRAVFVDTNLASSSGGPLVHEGTSRIAFHEEDASNSVIVLEQEIPTAEINLRRLYVGPTSMITDNLAAQRYTKLLGHLPMLLHPEPRNALVICLGTGMTLSAVAAHPALEQVDCAEISPAVRRAVHLFSHVNDGVLDNPRVHWITNDGRTHLAVTNRVYDVISLEPPPPDHSGAAALYSREFYRLCRKRMAEDGIIAQWIPYHLVSTDQARSMTAAMLAVFPRVTLWELYNATEYCLMGHMSNEPVPVERVRDALADERVGTSLVPVGIDSVADVAACFIMDTSALREFVGDAPPVTDDRPRIGYDMKTLGMAVNNDAFGAAVRVSLDTYGTLSGDPAGEVFCFADEESEKRFRESYRTAKTAWLMERKMTVIARLGMDEFEDHFNPRQTLMPPALLEPDNPMYSSRPSVSLQVGALNRIAIRREQQKRFNEAILARMQVGRLKRLLPPLYLKEKNVGPKNPSACALTDERTQSANSVQGRSI